VELAAAPSKVSFVTQTSTAKAERLAVRPLQTVGGVSHRVTNAAPLPTSPTPVKMVKPVARTLRSVFQAVNSRRFSVC